MQDLRKQLYTDLRSICIEGVFTGGLSLTLPSIEEGTMDVSRLTPTEVAELLKREKISERGIVAIVENKLDGEALLLLEKDEHFAAIGIKLGDMLKLKKIIAKHKTAEQPVTTSSTDQSVRVRVYINNNNLLLIMIFCFTKWLPV